MSQFLSYPPVQTTVDTSLRYYEKFISPLFKPENKKTTISVAVSLFAMYYIREKYIKPPKHLRHIPVKFHLSEIITTVVKGESKVEEEERILMPFINAKDGQDTYMRLSFHGWTVFFSDPEDCKRTLMKYEKIPNAAENYLYTLLVKFIGGPNLLFLNGQRWKQQRMIANPAFHRNMPVNLFGHLSQDLFAIIDEQDGKADFSDLMRRFTLEAIGRAGFDFEFNALKSTDNEWIQIYTDINDEIINPLFAIFPKLEKKSWLRFFPKRQLVHQKLDKFLSMLDDVIINKKEKMLQGDLKNDDLAENEKDILTLLIESELRGEGVMSNAELQANLCVFFFAGHDTTSSALSSAIYYLAINPDIQSKAREEAINILGDEPEDVLPSIMDTRNMNYIDCIIKEVLRISPPVGNTGPRVVDEDMITTAGVHIPKGTLAVPNMYAMQHNSRVWKDPYVFNPERFDESSEIAATRKKSDWLPFGSGPRQCIGMNFSLNEQRVLLSMLLRKYEWSLPENSIHKDKLLFEGFVVSSPKQLDINFKRRY